MRITVGESPTWRATSPILRYSFESIAAITLPNAAGESLCVPFGERSFSLDSFLSEQLTLPDYSKVCFSRNLCLRSECFAKNLEALHGIPHIASHRIPLRCLF